MVSTVSTARFNQDNRTTLWDKRRHISVRPVAFVNGSLRRTKRPLAVARSGPANSFGKRMLDVAAAGAALLFFAPFWLAVAIAIKVSSPGPVLFHQERYGYGNRLFRIYKFRSMRSDSCDAGVRQAVQGDSRVTRVGKFLRMTSLDEIPQLLNVLKGDMSLVGPRPHVPGMLAADVAYEDLVPYYFQRHTARPGITGLAQVSGCRGSTVEAERAISRIDYDLEYIENWSLGMDVMILFRTIRREFLSGSAF